MFIRLFFLISLCVINVYAKENRERIIIIDTGYIESLAPEISKYACEDQYNFTEEKITHPHGTSIAKLITENLDSTKYCFSEIAYYTFPVNELIYVKSLEKAVELDGILVNMSLSGSKIIKEEKSIKQLLKQKKYVVVSGGNDGEELKFPCEIYPVCYDLETYRVGAINSEGLIAPYSNFGSVINRWALGTFEWNLGKYRGTSYSTARISNQLIRKRDTNASLPSNHPTSKRKRTSRQRLYRTRKRSKAC